MVQILRAPRVQGYNWRCIPWANINLWHYDWYSVVLADKKRVVFWEATRSNWLRQIQTLTNNWWRLYWKDRRKYSWPKGIETPQEHQQRQFYSERNSCWEQWAELFETRDCSMKDLLTFKLKEAVLTNTGVRIILPFYLCDKICREFLKQLFSLKHRKFDLVCSINCQAVASNSNKQTDQQKLQHPLYTEYLNHLCLALWITCVWPVHLTWNSWILRFSVYFSRGWI